VTFLNIQISVFDSRFVILHVLAGVLRNSVHKSTLVSCRGRSCDKPPHGQSQPWHLRRWLRSPPTCFVIIALSFVCNCDARLQLPILFTMISSGFTNAPVSQFLVFSTVIGALFATITDTRYYIHIAVVPHIWTYGQFWRFLTWQVSLLLLFPAKRCRDGRKERVARESAFKRKLIMYTGMLHKLN